VELTSDFLAVHYIKADLAASIDAEGRHLDAHDSDRVIIEDILIPKLHDYLILEVTNIELKDLIPLRTGSLFFGRSRLVGQVIVLERHEGVHFAKEAVLIVLQVGPLNAQLEVSFMVVVNLRQVQGLDFNLTRDDTSILRSQ